MKYLQNKKKICILVILLIFFLTFLGIFFGAKIKNVHVVGCEYYTEEQIENKVLHSGVTENTFGLYFTYAFNRGVEIPFVEKISVEVTGVHSVDIIISEKAMIGCIHYMSEYIYFDKDGVVVESNTEQLEGIPVIEGVNFTKMNLHEKLEVKESDEDIFERIVGVSQLLSKYEIDTDKVVFDSKKRVTLYVGDIRVSLGKRDMYDEQIAELSKLLPKAIKKKLKGELDMENFQEGQERSIFKMDK